MTKTINGEAQLHAKVDGKKIIVTESSVRRDLRLSDEKGIDCLLNSTIFKQPALMGKPTRKDTQVPQPSGPTKSVADEDVYKELGGSLVRAATNAFSLEAEQDSGGGPRVLELEKTKTTQHNEIASLKRRNPLEMKKVWVRSKQGRKIDAIDADEDITMVGVHDDTDNEMFDVDALDGGEIFIDKGKGIMIEEAVKTKKKDQIRLDEEAAKKLQAEFNEEERLKREKAKKNKELILL
nr:hypothetical protein [Tanacetum cinerariifolium]